MANFQQRIVQTPPIGPFEVQNFEILMLQILVQHLIVKLIEILFRNFQLQRCKQ